MIEPPLWTAEQIALDVAQAIVVFRKERIEEPLENYLDAFDKYRGDVEDLLDITTDLSSLDDAAIDILTDQKLLNAVRYLAGPPISVDDLKTLADVNSTVARRLRQDPSAVARIIQVIRAGLDRRRFPWVAEGREPDEHEKIAAVLASAALMAAQRSSTERRGLAKRTLEGETAQVLLKHSFKKIAARVIRTFSDAPRPGEFCGESVLGNRKADFIIGLWDNRIMAIECKASNSAVNSVKRINNDAAAKAEAWRSDFGHRQVIPTAVLSGVFKPHNLVNAQERGLTLFWSHNLQAMTDWIETTRPT